jgi:hypothetical protein
VDYSVQLSMCSDEERLFEKKRVASSEIATSRSFWATDLGCVPRVQAASSAEDEDSSNTAAARAETSVGRGTNAKC